jgi:hypothetical protein
MLYFYPMSNPADDKLLETLRRDWPLVPNDRCTEADLANLLAGEINSLIHDDFSRLLALLYRIDVDEQRLRQLLRDNPGSDAGRIIAWLIIDRQKEKIISREKFRNTGPDIPGEDKW